MLRRKRKGSKPDTEGEPATELPSPRPRAVTTDSGLLARAMVRESTKRDEQGTGGGTDDEREDRDGSKKKGGRMMDLKELVSQTKKNFKGGSGTLSLRWTATKKKKSSLASSLSSSDLRVHSSSAGEELSSDSDSSDSPANGLNARPRTERKRSKLTTDEGEDLFDGFRERPMSSRGSRSASSGYEHMSMEVGSNEGKGSLKARKAKPCKLLADRPAKRSELGDGAEQELCDSDKAIASLQLLPVEALESKRARGSSIPGTQCDLPSAPIPPPLNLPELTATVLPLGQFGLLAAPIPPPLELPIGPAVANSKPATKSASPPMKLLLSAPLPPPLNLPEPTTTTTTSSSGIYPALRPSAAAAPGISRRATSPRSSHSAPLPTIPLLPSPPPASSLATSGSRPTSAAPKKPSPSPSPLSAKPRPVLPTLRLPMGASGGLSPLSSLTSRAIYTPTPQSPSLSLVSPRYARSPLNDSNEGRRLLTPKPLGTVRSFEGRTESGGDLDKALEEMIYSRWKEYDNIRRIRSGNRRYRQSTRMSVLCEPEAIGKLETDANVFLGAIKEMVKRRSLSRLCEETQPSPTRATNKTRRRKEREMRMSRERNNAARASVGPGRIRYSMCLSSSDGLESSVDDSFPDLVSPSSSSPLSSSLEVPPPPPPPLPPSALLPLSPIAEEDGKWGVNMLSSEQPQAYEDLFTLTPAEIENVPGIYRWRIEHLVPMWIPQDDEDHPVNHFYESDCYLVLYVGRADEDDELDDGSPLKKDAAAGGDKEGALIYNLHYWIGRTASVDKKASVCFRAVQLNSYIGGKAKHYPEQYGEESATFLSYFRRTSRRPSLSGSGNVRTRSNSASTVASASMASTTTTTTSLPVETRDIVYLEGGTDSGLRRVKGVEEYDTARLYRFFTLEDDADDEDEQASSSDDPWALYAYDEYEAAARKRKQKRNGRHYFIQLVELATTSLNERDVFLLDTGGYRLYQWNGKQSRQWLNLVCNEILLMMNVIERKSLAQIEVLSGGEGEGPAVRRRRRSLFWRYLDGSHKRAAPEAFPQSTISGGNGGQEANPAGDQGQEKEEDGEEEAELPAKTELKEEEEEEEKNQARHLAEVDDDLADEALGGILEILEVRGEYGSMDLHTMWAQKKPAAASTTTIGHEEGLKPSRRILSSQGVFIIDCTSEIYVYSGRKSTPYSRQIATFIANQMKDDDNNKDDSRRPVWTITTEVKERQEPILFKARFSDWLDTDDSGKWGAKQKVAPKDYRPFHERLLDEIKKGKLKPPEQPDIDVASLFPPETQGAQHATAPELSAEAGVAPPAAGEVDEILELLNRVRSNSQSSADDNALTDSSSVEVGILSGRTFSKLPEAEVGHFYSGESYVVLHAFHDRAKDARQWVVYFWEGKGASKLRWPTFQLGIFPALEEKIVSSGSGAPAKRRIYQGEETPGFMRLFKNNLIVIRRGQRPQTATAAATTEMFEAKCQPGDTTKRLVSVECNQESLHSSGAYGLFLPSGKVFIWRGKQSLPQSTDALTWLIDAATASLPKDSPATAPPSQEHTPAADAASEHHEWRNGVDIHFIAEDEEPSEFWTALGCTASARARSRSEAAGEAATAADGGERGEKSCAAARLVKFCYDGGRFTAGEVVGFKQRDLLQNCVYLLRPHTAPAAEAPLYLWLGLQATDRLRAAARRTAERYVAHLVQTTATAATTATTATATTLTTQVEKNESDVALDTNKSEAAGHVPVVRVEEVEEGSEPGEFTRYFAEWAATGFVDPYELRLIELRKLGALAFDHVAADEQFREPLVRLLADDADADADGAEAAAALEAEAEAQPTPEELEERKKREREEFMRKLREDRLRKEERRRLREKKEEEEQLRRREKQDRLRAKLKLLELQVVHYKVDPDDEAYPDGSQTAHPMPEAWGTGGGADGGGDEQRRCDSARAAGSVPAMSRQRSQSTDVAVVRLKERQDQFINRLKNRSRSRISYAGKDRSSASSSVNLLLQQRKDGLDPEAATIAAIAAIAAITDSRPGA